MLCVSQNFGLELFQFVTAFSFISSINTAGFLKAKLMKSRGTITDWDLALWGKSGRKLCDITLNKLVEVVEEKKEYTVEKQEDVLHFFS